MDIYLPTSNNEEGFIMNSLYYKEKMEDYIYNFVHILEKNA